MENSKRIRKLIVVQAKCLECETERILYFSSGFTYGERVVATKSGKKCAYVNLLEEDIVQELEEYCAEIYSDCGISVLSCDLKRIVSRIYGITCDELEGEKIDTISNTKCPICLGEIVEDEIVGEQIKNVEVFKVTHHTWKSLSNDGRKEKIKQELIRQDYLR